MTIDELVDKLNEDLANEYSHWAFYLHAATSIRGLHREELGEYLMDAAKSEMAHIEEFKRMIQGIITRRKLNKDVGTKIALYPTDLSCPKAILRHALMMEDTVVSNYAQRIEDCCALQETGDSEDAIDGKYVELFLEDQLTDSRSDADHIREMLEGLCPSKN